MMEWNEFFPSGLERSVQETSIDESTYSLNPSEVVGYDSLDNWYRLSSTDHQNLESLPCGLSVDLNQSTSYQSSNETNSSYPSIFSLDHCLPKLFSPIPIPTQSQIPLYPNSYYSGQPVTQSDHFQHNDQIHSLSTYQLPIDPTNFSHIPLIEKKIDTPIEPLLVNIATTQSNQTEIYSNSSHDSTNQDFNLPFTQSNHHFGPPFDSPDLDSNYSFNSNFYPGQSHYSNNPDLLTESNLNYTTSSFPTPPSTIFNTNLFETSNPEDSFTDPSFNFMNSYEETLTNSSMESPKAIDLPTPPSSLFIYPPRPHPSKLNLNFTNNYDYIDQSQLSAPVNISHNNQYDDLRCTTSAYANSFFDNFPYANSPFDTLNFGYENNSPTSPTEVIHTMSPIEDESLKHLNTEVSLSEFKPIMDPKTNKYQCQHPGCNRLFPRTYNLKSHMLCHSGVKPHVCPSCSHAFARKHDLQRHIRTLHSGLRPFECKNCKQGFTKPDALVRHIKQQGKSKCPGQVY